MALLEGQQDVYQASLDEARIWLIDFFDDDKTRDALIASLIELRTENVGKRFARYFCLVGRGSGLSASSKKVWVSESFFFHFAVVLVVAAYVGALIARDQDMCWLAMLTIQCRPVSGLCCAWCFSWLE